MRGAHTDTHTQLRMLRSNIQVHPVCRYIRTYLGMNVQKWLSTVWHRMHTQTHMQMCTPTHMHVYAQTFLYTHIHTHILTYAYIYTPIAHTDAQSCTFVRMHKTHTHCPLSAPERRGSAVLCQDPSALSLQSRETRQGQITTHLLRSIDCGVH